VHTAGFCVWRCWTISFLGLIRRHKAVIEQLTASTAVRCCSVGNVTAACALLCCTDLHVLVDRGALGDPCHDAHNVGGACINMMLL